MVPLRSYSCVSLYDHVVRHLGRSCVLTEVLLRSHNWANFHKEIGEHLEGCCFVEVILSTLTRYCSEKIHDTQLETNIPLEFLEEKEKYEVLSLKSSSWNPHAKLGDVSTAQGTAGLVAALADLVHNLSLHHQDSLQRWNADGLFRMFFRCLCCVGACSQETLQLHTSVCRLLSRVSLCVDVHATISQTKDCIAALLRLLTPFHLACSAEGECSGQAGAVRGAALQLAGVLVGRRAGLAAVWRALAEGGGARAFLHTLLQAMRAPHADLNKAAFFCLNQMFNGFNKNPDLNESMDGIEHFLHDDILIISSDSKSATDDFSCEKRPESMPPTKNSQKSLRDANVMRLDEKFSIDKEVQCEATCLSEEIVIVLIDKFKFYESQNDLKARQQDEYYNILASLLASLLGMSSRARQFAYHLAFPYHLLHSLAQIRNFLTIDGKPVQILKTSHKNNPALENLNWILLLMTCLMTDCLAVKECFAENSLVLSLCKMWPWCLTTPRLRATTIGLLQTFTNDCPKGWSAMCSYVGQYCLLAEVCVVAGGTRGAGGARGSPALERACLQVLRNCSQHTHARALILKNDIMNTFNKLHPAISKPGTKLRASLHEWERLAETLSLYADGQTRMLDYAGSLCALATQARGCMLNVITNCSFNASNRAKILGSAEILQVFMATLNSGQLQQQVGVAGALWALASNNHKAKLTLRSCGVAACVSECVSRLRHTPHPSQPRATQLLTYVQRLLAS